MEATNLVASESLPVITERVVQNYQNLREHMEGAGLAIPEKYDPEELSKIEKEDLFGMYLNVCFEDFQNLVSDAELALVMIVLYKLSHINYEKLKEISQKTKNPYLCISCKERTILDYLLRE